LSHKSCTMCQPIKLQIHLWTNRKRLSSVEYASTYCGSGEYPSWCTLHLSYATDWRILLTFVLRSNLSMPRGALRICRSEEQNCCFLRKIALRWSQVLQKCHCEFNYTFVVFFLKIGTVQYIFI
jgi:hypothetical protein